MLSSPEEKSTATESEAGPTTARDAHRAALRELVDLASTCAAEEREIDKRRAAATAATERSAAEALAAGAARKEAATAAAAQAHEERIDKADGVYSHNVSSLREEAEVARRKVTSEARETHGRVKTELEHAVWLSESVYDATEARLGAELQKATEAVNAHVEALAAAEVKGAEIVARFGMRPEVLGVGADAGEIPVGGPEFTDDLERIASQTDALDSLRVPRLFVGIWPYLALAVVLFIAAVGAQVICQAVTGSPALRLDVIGASAGGALVLSLLAGWGLRVVAVRHTTEAYNTLLRTIAGSHALAGSKQRRAERERKEGLAEAVTRRDAEVSGAKDKFNPLMAKAIKHRDATLASVTGQVDRQMAKHEAQRSREKNAATAERDERLAKVDATFDDESARVRADKSAALQRILAAYQAEKAALAERWAAGLQQIQTPMAAESGSMGGVPKGWSAEEWQAWTPPAEFGGKVPFGELRVDIREVTEDVPKELEMPAEFGVPAFLAFPKQASLLLQSDPSGRPEVVRLLQATMVRLLTLVPPGRIKFTIFDPVGLGESFAGFMHLADYDESLVGGRIWTSAEQIDQRLADLTEHMETVIQKYLRNEFETIDDYNRQAGELAEPYRFLVVADLPTNFSADAMRRLASIASSGARCGVYALVSRDLRQPLPGGTHLDELEAAAVNLVWRDGRFVWEDEVFRKFPLRVDSPPPEERLNQILHVVGQRAKEASRVEVPFNSIAPAPDEFWSQKCDSEFRVPIGRMGAARRQALKLGKGVAQHALIAGKTGSGKSTLLHALVTNAAMWYSPDEVEFYLVDFKKGVEFKTYATHELPHARAIAVESDREFGLSVLQRIDAELGRRGEMYRRAGVQDMAAYRRETGKILPRTLLIIDEFQEFFSEDDKLAQDAAVLLDRLVRQGRAFGIHVLLGSQTIAGSSGLSRSTIGQMAVRIALQTSEADSQLILGDNNSAARLLSRPGEAIYNDQGGLIEGNSPFQIAWLADEQREVFLDRVRARGAAGALRRPKAVVFEGNAPADLAQNASLAELLAEKKWGGTTGAATAWLGDPVAIKSPTAVTFRRQSGSNVLVVGQQDESAAAMMAAAIASLAAAQGPRSARFVVFDGSPADSPLAGTFARVAAALPHDVKLVEWRGVDEALKDLADELTRRQGGDPADDSVFVLFYGLQRYRMLRKKEDSFSFSSDGGEKTARPDEQFAELLREGAPHGMHVIAWCDTPAGVERTLERSLLREFDYRVLFQMSATDSSNLIDSPAANRLGQHRALVFSEEQGTLEKFRPYSFPPPTWWQATAKQLKSKSEPAPTVVKGH